MRIIKKGKHYTKLYPKRGSVVFLREKKDCQDENALVCAKIMSRATKTGVHGPYYNIRREDGQEYGIYIDMFD